MSEEQGNLKDLQNFFKKRNQEVREENKGMTQIIGLLLEDIANSTSSEEEKERKKNNLIDLGKFIQVFDDNIIIQEINNENSDFVINKEGSSITLDHHNFNGDFESTNNELKLESVKNVIQLKKTSKQKDLGQKWLLLIIGGSQNSGEYSSIETSILKERFDSSFDKIFIFNSFQKKIFTLILK